MRPVHVQAAQAKARLAMPKKKKKGEDAVDENPVFEVPPDEKMFQGDPNDRKALLRHKQHIKARPSPVSPALGASPLAHNSIYRALGQTGLQIVDILL